LKRGFIYNLKRGFIYKTLINLTEPFLESFINLEEIAHTRSNYSSAKTFFALFFFILLVETACAYATSPRLVVIQIYKQTLTS